MRRAQHDAWIHGPATVVVVAAGRLLWVDARDWSWLVLAIVAVWTAEALKSALELLADAASPDYHPKVGQAKDAAAVVIGAVVFCPHTLRLLEGS